MPAKKKTGMVRVTPMPGLLGDGAHLHTSAGRVQFGYAITIPADEVELLGDKVRPADDDQPDFVDAPMFLAESVLAASENSGQE